MIKSIRRNATRQIADLRATYTTAIKVDIRRAGNFTAENREGIDAERAWSYMTNRAPRLEITNVGERTEHVRLYPSANHSDIWFEFHNLTPAPIAAPVAAAKPATAHTHCAHEATKAARAACRKARNNNI